MPHNHSFIRVSDSDELNPIRADWPPTIRPIDQGDQSTSHRSMPLHADKRAHRVHGEISVLRRLSLVCLTSRGHNVFISLMFPPLPRLIHIQAVVAFRGRGMFEEE